MLFYETMKYVKYIRLNYSSWQYLHPIWKCIYLTIFLLVIIMFKLIVEFHCTRNISCLESINKLMVLVHRIFQLANLGPDNQLSLKIMTLLFMLKLKNIVDWGYVDHLENDCGRNKQSKVGINKISNNFYLSRISAITLVYFLRFPILVNVYIFVWKVFTC